MHKPEDGGDAFYWTTGVVVSHEGDGWYKAHLEFWDGGTFDNDSTGGALRLRYQEGGVEGMIERLPVLIDDALALGIRFGVGAVGVALYLQGAKIPVEDADGLRAFADGREWEFFDGSGEVEL